MYLERANMLQFIYLNGIPVQLGSPLPTTITSLQIQMPPMLISFPSEQVPALKEWLNSIVDHLDCDYFSYNGVLISTNEITKF